jgi:predicted transcriptional regulator
MMDSPPPLEGLEARVMEEVWSHPDATVRDVMRAVNAETSRERAYTTFMTVLVRLHAKGLVERRQEANVYHYTPAISREQYARTRAQADVSALVAQHGDLALSEFARQVAGLDPERRAALERLAFGRD